MANEGRNWRFDPWTETFVGNSITQEAHVIDAGTYMIRLQEVPDTYATITIEDTPGGGNAYTRVTGAPTAVQVNIDGFNSNTIEADPYGTGLLKFHSSKAGSTVYVTYSGLGTPACLPGMDANFLGNINSPSWMVRPAGIEPIVARYEGGVQSIPTGTYTRLDFASKIEDDPGTDRVTTGASWVFQNDTDYKLICQFNVHITWEILTALSADCNFQLRVRGEGIGWYVANDSFYYDRSQYSHNMAVGLRFPLQCSGIAIIDSGTWLYAEAAQSSGNSQRIVAGAVQYGSNRISIASIGIIP